MKFILLGGTIDSFYDTDSCTAVPYKHSVIEGYLRDTVGADLTGVSFNEICMKDSRAVTDEDRQAICEIIEASEEKEFVVTHGTYTLFETAKFIEEHLRRKDVTVTVTGALIPLLGFSPTDAGFNLGASMANSRFNNPGIWVFIKGRAVRASEAVTLHTK